MNDYQLVIQEIAQTVGTPQADWDSRTATDVDRCIRRGINAVIHNVLSHQWSWMRPLFSQTTADGVRRYTLPSDFQQFIDHLCFDGDNYQHPPLEQLPATRLQQLYSEYPGTGVPCNYATEAAAHDGTTEQTQELVLHPTPNGIYQIVGLYQVGPILSMTSERPWFPGGAEFRELFVSSCLAQAEVVFTDGDLKTWREQFQMDLTAAVARDQRKGARNLGPMKGRRVQDCFRHKLQTQYEGHIDS
jgi:hypothetical protein